MLTARIDDGGEIVGVTTFNYQIKTPPYKIESIISDGYIDIGSNSIKDTVNSASPICYWDWYGRSLNYDYIYVNEQIKGVYGNDLNLSNYTDDEKEVLLTHRIASMANLIEEFGRDRVNNVTPEFYRKSREARTTRFDISSAIVQEGIGEARSEIVTAQLLPSNAINSYIMQNVPTVIEYFASTGSFEGKGFKEQKFTLLDETFTLQDIADEILEILQFGTLHGKNYYVLE